MMRPLKAGGRTLGVLTGLYYGAEAVDESLAVVGDADRIHQILVNLATNAAKATTVGGVTVRCERDAEVARFRVVDTGIGVSDAMRDAIFTPFVQVGRALNQPREGAGLGLSISRGLAEAMGGTLTIESSGSEGSTFTLTLPLAS